MKLFQNWIKKVAGIGLLLGLLLAAVAGAQTPPPPAQPDSSLPASDLVLIPALLPSPMLASESYVLVDVSSRQILVANNPDERREPASLTKLMTAYVVFSALKEGSIKPDQEVRISERARSTPGSRMFADPRVPVSVDDLVHGMVIQSGNDAAVALADLIAGDERAFAGLMNAAAQRLGLKNTHFENSTGLPNPDHYASAADLARIAMALIQDFPEYYPLYAEKEFRYNGISQRNRNQLLLIDPNVDGLKTGYTEKAGWCLAASSKRGERRLVAVVLGAPSAGERTDEARKLLSWGYQAFEVAQIYSTEMPVTTVDVYKGQEDEVALGFQVPHYIAVPKGQSKLLKIDIQIQQPLIAPLSASQAVGSVRILFDGKQVAQYPLLTKKAVAEAGFFGRGWDSVKLWFN